MGITAADVNKLRKATGAGMMDCKKALQEANGDFDAAVDYLRKKGQKVSAKRADKEATEGVVIAKTSGDNQTGIIIALNCETDFVAKNADFQSFAHNIADIAIKERPASLEELKNLQMDGKPLSSKIEEQVGKVGEKLDLSSYEKVEDQAVVAYNHLGNKIGVLVALNKGGKTEFEGAARDVAMQIAAMNPVALNKEEVPQDQVDRELEVAREQIKAEGKPDHLVDKIAQGKLNKFFQENTLLEQSFVKDSSKSVKQFLKEVDNELTITSFKRVSIGEA